MEEEEIAETRKGKENRLRKNVNEERQENWRKKSKGERKFEGSKGEHMKGYNKVSKGKEEGGKDLDILKEK